MNLDIYDSPDDLYRTRGHEVNPSRPLFTGDVFQQVAISGVQEKGMALILAHPCSFRRGGGQLQDRLLVASVERGSKVGANAWRTGYFDRMPLQDVAGRGYWFAQFDNMGQSLRIDLEASTRLACLSAFGINMLQQRLTFYLTRAEIETHVFNEAFSHTVEEADLLEEWNDVLVENGWTQAQSASAFDHFLRSGTPSYQERLLSAQHRSAVRRACKQEVKVLAERGCSS